MFTIITASTRGIWSHRSASRAPPFTNTQSVTNYAERTTISGPEREERERHTLTFWRPACNSHSIRFGVGVVQREGEPFFVCHLHAKNIVAYLQTIVLLQETLRRRTRRLRELLQIVVLVAQQIQLMLESGRPAFVVIALLAQRCSLVFLLLLDGGCKIECEWRMWELVGSGAQRARRTEFVGVAARCHALEGWLR